MIPAFVDADQSFALQDWTVGDLLSRAATAVPEHVALRVSPFEADPACEWTYADLLAQSRKLALFLLSYFSPGEFVAIWAANSAHWTLYQLAAAQAGLVLVTINPAWRLGEVEPLIRRSGAVGLIVDQTHRGIDLISAAECIRSSVAHLRIVLLADECRSHIAAAPGGNLSVHVQPHDPAILLFTSGTTGQPKGVLLNHYGIVNNALSGADRFGLDERLAWFGVLPMFHVGGSVTCTLGCISRFGTLIVVPTFRPGVALNIIEKERIAWLPVVPAMVMGMIEHDAFATTDLGSLQVIMTGGTIITPDFVKLLRENFHTDVQVIFGQTEAGGGMCLTMRDDSDKIIAATAGRPYPHTAVRIADLKTGNTVGVGEAGEIRIRSPFMAKQYFNDPTASASLIDSSGFVRTGDIGTLDEHGYLRVTGRLKEVIIRGGENIYPREIEDQLTSYPGIVESAVVGVPSERWGEELAVAIRCSPTSVISVTELQDFLRARIARHKVPKIWKIVDDFPRTASGKIQKFEVAKWFVEKAAPR